MFLKSIQINSYRSIQNAKINFEKGLNILIGKNGVGKSNLLKYINQNVSYNAIISRTRYFRNTNAEFEYIMCIDSQDNNESEELTVYFKRDRIINNKEIDFTRELKLSKTRGPNIVYANKSIELSSTNIIRRKNEELDNFLKDFDVMRKFKKSYILYEIPSDLNWLSSSVKYEIDADLDLNNDDVHSDFSILMDFIYLLELNLLSAISSENEVKKIEEIKLELIREIFINSFENFKENYNIDQCLSNYSPIAELRLNPNINIYFVENKILIENIIIEFKVNESWIPWSYLSDGTKRLFYLITECLSLDKGGLLLIEEPELGIHPHQLYSLLNFIKDQSENKQIIISTHSPIVLDILNADELNRISIVKLIESGTQFYKLDSEQIQTATEYMEKVGDLSYYWLHSDLENE